MAVDLFSENSSMGMSPRISFSHDLCQTDIVPVEQHHPSLVSSSSNDFDFHVRESFDQDSSSADELFSDGKILPTQIKKKIATPRQSDQYCPSTASLPPRHAPKGDTTITIENSKKEGSKDVKDVSLEAEEKQNSRSFWRFKRSSSLNCGSGYRPSLCPLPLLSRSNSTGSTPNVKRSSLSKDGNNHKQHSQKQSSGGSVKASKPASSTASYQKPPAKKSYGNYGNIGVQVNPVLNISSASFFGISSIFSNGKDKSKKK